jgi:hypothetical protein
MVRAVPTVGKKYDIVVLLVLLHSSHFTLKCILRDIQYFLDDNKEVGFDERL